MPPYLAAMLNMGSPGGANGALAQDVYATQDALRNYLQATTAAGNPLLIPAAFQNGFH